MLLSLSQKRALVHHMLKTEPNQLPLCQIGLSKMVALDAILPVLNGMIVPPMGFVDDETCDALRITLERVASAETSYDAQAYERVCQKRPLAGHCKASSWVVQQLLGGIIVYAKMPSGVAHYWNLLPQGQELDITAPQYEGRYKGNGRDPVVPFTHIAMPTKNTNARFKKLYKRYQEKAAL